MIPDAGSTQRLLIRVVRHPAKEQWVKRLLQDHPSDSGMILNRPLLHVNPWIVVQEMGMFNGKAFICSANQCNDSGERSCHLRENGRYPIS